MPSPYSSEGSLQDSLALASRLNLATSTVPIEPLMQQYDGSLDPALGQKPEASPPKTCNRASAARC